MDVEGWRKEGHADKAVVNEIGGELCIVACHIGDLPVGPALACSK